MLALFDVAEVDMSWRCSVPEAAAVGLARAAPPPSIAIVAAESATAPSAPAALVLNCVCVVDLMTVPSVVAAPGGEGACVPGARSAQKLRHPVSLPVIA